MPSPLRGRNGQVAHHCGPRFCMTSSTANRIKPVGIPYQGAQLSHTIHHRGLPTRVQCELVYLADRNAHGLPIGLKQSRFCPTKPCGCTGHAAKHCYESRSIMNGGGRR
jgi:hypothetical protein